MRDIPLERLYQKFTAALCTISPNCKQWTCLSRMKYTQQLKTIWINLRNTMLGEINQTQRSTSFVIPFIWRSFILQNLEKGICGDKNNNSGCLHTSVCGMGLQGWEGWMDQGIRELWGIIEICSISCSCVIAYTDGYILQNLWNWTLKGCIFPICNFQLKNDVG